MQSIVAGFTACVDQLPRAFSFLIEFLRFDANPFRFCRVALAWPTFKLPSDRPRCSPSAITASANWTARTGMSPARLKTSYWLQPLGYLMDHACRLSPLGSDLQRELTI
jgi:hypothetical protein